MEKNIFFFHFNRIRLLNHQCQTQCERAEQFLQFHRQWQNRLEIVHQSFTFYGEKLIDLRQEQTDLVHLDRIEVRRIVCFNLIISMRINSIVLRK